MKKFLVLLIAVSLLLVFYTPVMARGGHGGGSYHGGGHGGYRGGWVGPFVGGAIIGGALGYGYAPRYYPPTYYYPPPYYGTSPATRCFEYRNGFDESHNPLRYKVEIPCQ